MDMSLLSSFFFYFFFLSFFPLAVLLVCLRRLAGCQLLVDEEAGEEDADNSDDAEDNYDTHGKHACGCLFYIYIFFVAYE